MLSRERAGHEKCSEHGKRKGEKNGESIQTPDLNRADQLIPNRVARNALLLIWEQSSRIKPNTNYYILHTPARILWYSYKSKLALSKYTSGAPRRIISIRSRPSLYRRPPPVSPPKSLEEHLPAVMPRKQLSHSFAPLRMLLPSALWPAQPPGGRIRPPRTSSPRDPCASSS